MGLCHDRQRSSQNQTNSFEQTTSDSAERRREGMYSKEDQRKDRQIQCKVSFRKNWTQANLSVN